MNGQKWPKKYKGRKVTQIVIDFSYEIGYRSADGYFSAPSGAWVTDLVPGWCTTIQTTRLARLIYTGEK